MTWCICQEGNPPSHASAEILFVIETLDPSFSASDVGDLTDLICLGNAPESSFREPRKSACEYPPRLSWMHVQGWMSMTKESSFSPRAFYILTGRPPSNSDNMAWLHCSIQRQIKRWVCNYSLFLIQLTTESPLLYKK